MYDKEVNVTDVGAQSSCMRSEDNQLVDETLVSKFANNAFD